VGRPGEWRFYSESFTYGDVACERRQASLALQWRPLAALSKLKIFDDRIEGRIYPSLIVEPSPTGAANVFTGTH